MDRLHASASRVLLGHGARGLSKTMLLSDLTPEILPTRAALLAGDVVLIALAASDAGDRVLQQAGLVPPYGTVEVQAGSRPFRIAAVRAPAGGLDNLVAALSRHQCSPAHDAAAGLGGIAGDVMDLAADLDPPSGRKLLGFLLGFCRTAFGLGADAAFARTCLQLAQSCGRIEGDAEPVATAGAQWMIVSGVCAPRRAVLYVLGPASVRHSAAPAGDDKRGLQVVVPVGPGEMLLALG